MLNSFYPCKYLKGSYHRLPCTCGSATHNILFFRPFNPTSPYRKRPKVANKNFEVQKGLCICGSHIHRMGPPHWCALIEGEGTSPPLTSTVSSEPAKTVHVHLQPLQGLRKVKDPPHVAVLANQHDLSHNWRL